MANNIKAQVARVRFGHLSIEGLMAEDGNFLVSVPQVVEQFSVDTKQPARHFRSLLGEGSTVDVKVNIAGTRLTVNAMLLDTFEKLVAKLDRAGNKAAQDFRDDLAGLSLRQMFCDAFDVRFDEVDRQDWLKARQEGKLTRRTFTDAIKEYLGRHPELSQSRVKFMYSNASDRVNQAVMGRIARTLCKDFNCEKDELRNNLTDQELRHISMIEEEAMLLVDRVDLEPCDAVLSARSKFSFDLSTRTAA